VPVRPACQVPVVELLPVTGAVPRPHLVANRAGDGCPTQVDCARSCGNCGQNRRGNSFGWGCRRRRRRRECRGDCRGRSQPGKCGILSLLGPGTHSTFSVDGADGEVQCRPGAISKESVGSLCNRALVGALPSAVSASPPPDIVLYSAGDRLPIEVDPSWSLPGGQYRCGRSSRVSSSSGDRNPGLRLCDGCAHTVKRGKCQCGKNGKKKMEARCPQGQHWRVVFIWIRSCVY